MGHKNSYMLYYFVSKLSLLQHSFYYLYKTFERERPKTLGKKVLHYLQEAMVTYELLYDAFYKKELSLAHGTRKKADEVLKSIQKDIEKTKDFDSQLLMQIGHIARSMAESSTVLFGLEFEDPREKI